MPNPKLYKMHFAQPRIQRHRLATSFWGCFVFGAICVFIVVSSRGQLAVADELPPHFAEKTVMVEVREDEIFIEFRVGISVSDMERICREAKIELADDTPSELMSKFTKLITPQVTENFHVEINGEKVDLQVSQALAGGIHHVSSMLEFKIPFKPTETVANLKIVDRSFSELDGAIRLACKTRGAVMTRRSNVPVAIVRAQRVVFTECTAEERESASTIETQILISD
ncbi:MAG: hypothetical protein KF851_04005 [Pirellulaceae bacterium]|nr:hypothetical protein [Pirellulaceae bacterium]